MTLSIKTNNHARGRERVQHESEDLPALGWIRITYAGGENLYFRAQDDSPSHPGRFCKIDK